jgi:hypothetical protein
MKANVKIAQLTAMNRAQRRAKKQPMQRSVHTAQNSPVGRVINKARSAFEFKNQIFSLRIQILEMIDGCDATETLASLAVVIGTVAQAGASQHGSEPAWVRQLHGALRTVEAMCHAGYKWQAKYSAAMEIAVGIAAQDRPELDPDSFMAAWDLAVGFADRIFDHNIADEEVSA